MARIVTSTNAGYTERIKPYLESLSRYSQLPVTLVCVGDFLWDPHLDGVNSVMLSRAQNYGAPHETECTQHGSWLRVVGGDPGEKVIYTDGDIIMQRPFTDAELDWIADLPDGVVAAGYNSGPDETLEVEAERLFPRFLMRDIERRLGPLSLPCYNIGAMVARRSTYQAIYDEYMKHWQVASDAFGHAARQQWLFVWTAHRLGIEFRVTPYSFHANGHYGMPPGCHYVDGQLYSGDELVLFRHKL